jgi:hypothetical protein
MTKLGTAHLLFSLLSGPIAIGIPVNAAETATTIPVAIFFHRFDIGKRDLARNLPRLDGLDLKAFGGCYRTM